MYVKIMAAQSKMEQIKVSMDTIQMSVDRHKKLHPTFTGDKKKEQEQIHNTNLQAICIEYCHYRWL